MLNAIRKRSLRSRNGRLLGRPPGEGAQHLLVGLATCASCNASMETRSRRQVRDQIWLVSFMDYDHMSDSSFLFPKGSLAGC